MSYDEAIAEYQRRCDKSGLPGKVHYRLDIHEGLKLRKPVMTAEGYLLVEGKMARPGVLEYVNADGSIRRELITAEELHNADSLGTLGRKPITMLHPNEDVDPDNHQDLAVGDIDATVEFEPPEQGGHVIVKLAIKRRDAIEAIQSGDLPELSPGYLTRIIEEPGEHPIFGPYDAIQTDRRYNHGALVPEARGGRSVALHLDGAAYAVSPTDKPNEDDSMKSLLLMLSAIAAVPRADMVDPEKVKLALMGAEIPEEEAGKIAETIASIATPEESEDASDDIDMMREKLKTANLRIQELESREGNEDAGDEEEENEDGGHEEDDKKDQETDEEKAAAEVAKKADRLDHFESRVGIFNMALAYEMNAEDIKKLDNAQLKRKVVETACEDLPDDASDTYIDVRYDMLLKIRTDAASEVDAYVGFDVPAYRRSDKDTEGPQVRHDGDATVAASNGLKLAQANRAKA